jgi:hypothetical protein
MNDRNQPPKTIPKIRDSATHTYILFSHQKKNSRKQTAPHRTKDFCKIIKLEKTKQIST